MWLILISLIRLKKKTQLKVKVVQQCRRKTFSAKPSNSWFWVRLYDQLLTVTLKIHICTLKLTQRHTRERTH